MLPEVVLVSRRNYDPDAGNQEPQLTCGAQSDMVRLATDVDVWRRRAMAVLDSGGDFNAVVIDA